MYRGVCFVLSSACCGEQILIRLLSLVEELDKCVGCLNCRRLARKGIKKAAMQGNNEK